MSNIYVADTMAIVLYLESRKLPVQVKQLFDGALNNENTIYISAITLMEIGYLSKRLRIDTTIEEVTDHTTKHNSFKIIDLDANIIKTAFQIDDIPELHDRLIAASAVYTNSLFITNDPLIRASKHLNTTW